MDIVPLGKSVKDALKEGEVITKLVERITSIPNHATTLKFDIGLTLYIANIVENEFIDKPADQKKLIILTVLPRRGNSKTKYFIFLRKNSIKLKKTLYQNEYKHYKF